MPAADPPRLMLIGHSHLRAIEQGCREAGLPPQRYAMLLLLGIEEEWKQHGHAVLLQRVREAAEAHIRGFARVGADGRVADHVRDGGIHLLISVGGNEHNVLGMVNTGGSHDFLLPGCEDEAELLPGSTIVPCGAVLAQMQRHAGYFRDVLGMLTEMAGGRAVLLESPPPVREEAFIRAHFPPMLAQIHGDGVAINPASFRYKLWRLRCLLYRDECERLGIRYVDTPDELMEQGRYLSPQAMLGDATHANAWFGGIMLRRALAMLAE